MKTAIAIIKILVFLILMPACIILDWAAEIALFISRWVDYGIRRIF